MRHWILIGVKEKRIYPDALRFCNDLHEILLLLVVSFQVRISGDWGPSPPFSKTVAAPFLDTSTERNDKQIGIITTLENWRQDTSKVCVSD